MNNMNEEIFAQESLFQKYQNTQSSGYLDDQFQISPSFRQVEQYHFRIQDDNQIIQLQKLQKNSKPLTSGFVIPNQASGQFNKKMNDLLSSLDSAAPIRQNQIYFQPQTHGYYKISEGDYDQKKTLEAAYQHLQLNSLNKRMQNLTIDNKNIKFKNKANSNNIMKQQKQQNFKKQVITKMNKLSISDSQF